MDHELDPKQGATGATWRRAPLLPTLLLAAFALLLAACGGEEILPLETLTRGCLARNACDVLAYPRVADCVAGYYDLQLYYGLGAVYAKAYRCAAAIKGDCVAIAQCFGVQRGGPRCEKSFVGSCDGARALSCDLISGQSYSEDCALAGLSCAVPTSGGFSARCSPGACDASFRRRCQGTRAESCADGLIEVVDCAARGQTCLEAGGAASCVGASSESCASGQPRCEGQIAVSCVGGRVARQDCSARPSRRRCQDGVCVEAGTECGGEVDRCQGVDLEACLEGSWQRFDCGALGFLGCQPGQTGAACGPPN